MVYDGIKSADIPRSRRHWEDAVMEKIRALAVRYREQLVYLVVGVLTTVVNYVIYGVLTGPMGVHYVVSNVIGWVGAVAFAYFANGRWVFRSVERRGVKEAAAFVGSRLFSLGLETALLMVMVDALHMDKMLAKLAVAVVVVIVNYLTGRLVFKGRKGK